MPSRDDERREREAAARRAQREAVERGRLEQYTQWANRDPNDTRRMARPRRRPAPTEAPARSQVRVWARPYVGPLGGAASTYPPADRPNACPFCGALQPGWLGGRRFVCDINRLVTKNYGCGMQFEIPQPSEGNT